MAGLLNWSYVWYKTQPEIAKGTRVCAFDRAGYGFSDPAPKPEIMADVVNDLHAALVTGTGRMENSGKTLESSGTLITRL